MCLGCHVVALEIEMKDLNAIKAACNRLGWKFKQNQTTYKWYGNWVDDSPVPRQLFTSQEEYDKVVAMNKPDRQKYMNDLLGKCTHAISVPGTRYEIGLIQQGNKFVPIWDWFDRSLQKAMGAGGKENAFAQAYGIEKATLQAQAQGLMYQETALEDGRLKLTVQVPNY